MKKSCGYKEASTRLHAATRLDVTVHLLDKHYTLLPEGADLAVQTGQPCCGEGRGERECEGGASGATC